MQEVAKQEERALCIGIAERGIRTSTDFANLMSAMMSDLAVGRLTPQVGNAMCNAGGKLLKVVEMQQKYGTKGEGQHKVLQLAEEPPAIV
jgi:hypothetical protein